VDLLIIAILGACGGALVQVLDLCSKLADWQRERHEARASKGIHAASPLSEVLDPLSDTLVLLTRIILGAAAALLFHAQVSGSTAAVAIGAAAPALLRQLGELRPAVNLDANPVPQRPRPVISASIEALGQPESVPEAAE
jgi:hypothetical protein